MKKIFLGALLAIACFQPMSAQNHCPERHHHRNDFSIEKMVQRLDRAVDLTEEQEKQVTAVYTDYIKDIHCKENCTRKDRKTCRVEMEKKLNAILTKEQQEKWAAIKQARIEKRQARQAK